MPVGDVLVGDTGSDIEHDDTALTLDVVTITETTELFLSSGIPNVEADSTEVSGERKRVNLNTKSGHVLLLEFTSQVALDKRGLHVAMDVSML